MARTATRELHSSDVDIEQKDDINIDPKNRESDIIVAAKVADKEYLAEVAFNEDPITICISRSPEKNAASTVPVWVNGKGAEIWHEGGKRWLEITHLPVERDIIIKRKYVAVLACAKQDRVETTGTDPEDIGKPGENRVQRFTSSLCSFSVIHDPSPRGRAWLVELLRRNG
jgi:hypothetical protein